MATDRALRGWSWICSQKGFDGWGKNLHREYECIREIMTSYKVMEAIAMECLNSLKGIADIAPTCKCGSRCCVPCEARKDLKRLEKFEAPPIPVWERVDRAIWLRFKKSRRKVKA